jgi:Flp pilus assembly protein TadG
MRGTAALEFGLFAPLLMIMLVYIVELGESVFEAMQVQNAAEAGAVYAAKHGWNSAGISAAVVNSSGLAGVTASPAPYEFCGCPAADAITSSACATTCTSGAAAGTYVKISAAFTHQTILAYPGMVSPTTLTGVAIVRVN